MGKRLLSFVQKALSKRRTALWVITPSAVFLLWLVCVIAWTGPRLVFSRAFATGEITLQGLGSFGDSFGVVTALFSGIAVVLVYLTYGTQKAELNHLRAHLGIEQRRQRASEFLNRMESKLERATLGNQSGSDLVRWMNNQLEEVFPMEVVMGGSAERKWRAVLDRAGPLPDTEPLMPAVFNLLGLARVYAEAAQPGEAKEIADLARSAVTTEALIPFLYATAVTLRGRHEELRLVSNFLAAIGVRPVITRAFDLSQVPGGIPLTLDDTLQ